MKYFGICLVVSRKCTTFAAVSYTHLDVYKRQPVINYGTDKGGKRDKKGRDSKRPSKQQVIKKTKEWEDKYKDGAKPVIDLSQFIIKK